MRSSPSIRSVSSSTSSIGRASPTEGTTIHDRCTRDLFRLRPPAASRGLRREAGAQAAAETRLRPILMTAWCWSAAWPSGPASPSSSCRRSMSSSRGTTVRRSRGRHRIFPGRPPERCCHRSESPLRLPRAVAPRGTGLQGGEVRKALGTEPSARRSGQCEDQEQSFPSAATTMRPLTAMGDVHLRTAPQLAAVSRNTVAPVAPSSATS
jgi:hypothetical protein